MKRITENIILILFLVSSMLLCIDTADTHATRDSLKTSTNFPAGLDDWTAEEGGNPEDAIDRWWWNDVIILRAAVESVQAEIGSTNTVETGALRYRVSTLEGSIPSLLVVDSALVAGSSWVAIAKVDSAIYADTVLTKADSAVVADTSLFAKSKVDSSVNADSSVFADTARYAGDFNVTDSLTVESVMFLGDTLVSTKTVPDTIYFWNTEGTKHKDSISTVTAETYQYLKGWVFVDSFLFDFASGKMASGGTKGVSMTSDGFNVGDAAWDSTGLFFDDSTDVIAWGEVSPGTLKYTSATAQFELNTKMKFPGGYLGDGDSLLILEYAGGDGPTRGVVYIYLTGEKATGLLMDVGGDGAISASGSDHWYGIEVSVAPDTTPTGASNVRGVFSSVTGQNAGGDDVANAYAGYFVASSGSTAYGIYATAGSAEDTNWAGYFADADVKIEEDLVVDSVFAVVLNASGNVIVAGTATVDTLVGDVTVTNDITAVGIVRAESVSVTMVYTLDLEALGTATVDSLIGNVTITGDLVVDGTVTVDTATVADTSLFAKGKVDSSTNADSAAYADTTAYSSYSGWSYDGAAADTADYAHGGDSVNFAINSDTAGYVSSKVDSATRADTATVADTALVGKALVLTDTVVCFDDGYIFGDSIDAKFDTLWLDHLIVTTHNKLDSAEYADTAFNVINSDSANYADHAGEADSASSGVFLASDSIKIGAYTVLWDSNLVVDSITANYVSAGVTSDSVEFSDTTDWAKDWDASAITWGDALVPTGTDEVDVQLAATWPGLEFSLGMLRVDVDDNTIARGANGIRVKQNVYDEIGDANTTFDESNTNPDCGAALIGFDNTETDHSSGTNVQDVIDDLDAQITAYSDSVHDFQITGTLTADSLISNITMTNDLAVEGTITCDSLLGSVNVGHDLVVEGTATIDSLLASVDIAHDLVVNGTLTADSLLGSVDVASDLTVTDDLVVSSTLTADSLVGSATILHDFTIDGMLTVDSLVGDLTVTDDLTVSSTLIADSLVGDLTITDDLTVSSTLTADSLVGSVTILHDLVVDGTTTADSLLGSVDIAHDLVVNGTATIDSLLGSVDIASDLVVTDDLTVSSTLIADSLVGDLTITDDLTVSSTLTADSLVGSVTILHDLVVDGTTTADSLLGSVDIAHDLVVNGFITTDSLSGNQTIVGDLAVDGGITVDSLVGDQTLVGDLAVDGGITVDTLVGNIDFTGNITVAGTATIDSISGDLMVDAGDLTADTLKGELKPASGNRYLYRWCVGPMAIKSISADWQSGDQTDPMHTFKDTVVIDNFTGCIESTGDDWEMHLMNAATDDTIASSGTLSGAGYLDFAIAVNDSVVYTSEGIYFIVDEEADGSTIHAYLSAEGYYLNP